MFWVSLHLWLLGLHRSVKVFFPRMALVYAMISGCSMSLKHLATALDALYSLTTTVAQPLLIANRQATRNSTLVVLASQKLGASRAKE
jgi:hypothetical protein